jgi:toxoflavin synthase
MKNYDKIADDYVKSRQAPYYKLIDYMWQQNMPAVKEKKVLHLACGAGYYTKKIKQMGASHVLAIDSSEEMLRLAREDETTNLSGVKYLHKDVISLGQIGEFDVVVATFLLHYARNKDELLKMCQAASLNTINGGYFVSINNNFGKQLEFSPDAYHKYGLTCNFSDDMKDGDIIGIDVGYKGSRVQFDTYFYSKKTYMNALKKAGFSEIELHYPVYSQDIDFSPDVAPDSSFWDFYIENPTQVLIKCKHG